MVDIIVSSRFYRTEKTIQTPASLEGLGIHSGKHSRVVLRPSYCDSGIRIGLNDFHGDIYYEILPSRIFGLEGRTAIRIDNTLIQTVEHLMASLAYLDVSNICIAVCEGKEIPILDGSAWAIIEKINEVGLTDLKRRKRIPNVINYYTQQFNNSEYAVVPSPVFHLDVTIDFLSQSFDSSFHSNDYEKFLQIVRSRSFIFEEDLVSFHSKKIGLGISEENCIVINKTGDLDPNILQGCIYHKILDFIGDTYLTVGCLPTGHFILRNPHHKYNIMFTKEYLQTNIIDCNE